MLWSIRSKPLLKSAKNIRPAESPESTASYIACSIYKRTSVVDCSLRAYCLGSIFLFSCESSLVQVMPSITFAIVHVSEIGLKSVSTSFGGTIFGTHGNNNRRFQKSWYIVTACRSFITGANSKLKSLSNLFGMSSGPTALVISIHSRD